MSRKIIKLTLLILILILLIAASIGPSKEPEKVPLDGSYSSGDESPLPSTETEPSLPPREAIIFRTMEIEIRKNPQVVYMLELDLQNPDLEVFPALAQDKIFGFEYLSDINKRYSATAIVNAGFNYSYGQPSGLVIQNGRILSGSIGYGKILLINDGKGRFQDAPFKVWIEAGDERLPVDAVNSYPEIPGILVYTPEFGLTNRIEKTHSFCVVENNRVVSSGVADKETKIPKDGFLISDLRTDKSPLLELKPGQKISLVLEEEAEQAYQCSGALVNAGENVAKDEDPWAGNLRIPTPRTAVGLINESTLVLLVVDGRQPGYSIGVTGSELADILISVGVTEAAILDGGASSEMIYRNEIANRPSTGRERLLASCFVIVTVNR